LLILGQLLRDTPLTRLNGSPETPVLGLAQDSRRLRPGDLFFALPGARTDGNRYAESACAAGAAAVVSEQPVPAGLDRKIAWAQVSDASLAMSRMAATFFGRPSQALTVAGVTGTNGKTTTTYFLESIISACGGSPGVIGTVDYRLAGRRLESAPNTTPSSLDLQRLLARFRDGGATLAALEVSSHALALRRVEDVGFDAAVFTNLASDHLDFHKSQEEYFRAKLRLFELLTASASAKPDPVAVLNADDPRAPDVRRAAAKVRIVDYALAAPAALRAVDVALSASGTRFTLLWQGRRIEAEIALRGGHNVANATAAAAAALALGLPESGVRRGLAALARVPGRLEPVEAGQDFQVLIDYAHTAMALETVLRHLSAVPHRRIITVFGCGGDRDRGKRGPMALAAARGSDFAVATSDNPRGEDPGRILADVEAAWKTAGIKNYKILADRGAAIAAAVAMARAGDIVLIAGKGHETVQILKDRTVPFDDREAARAALRDRSAHES
jgi:UDP-N-acetylmuramoyl-L-alanyl-D-glutamate--2,6-diaminopimelate ligase